LHTFVWDGRYPPAQGIQGGTWLVQGSLRGPVVLPGTYQVRFRAEGRSYRQSFQIRRHPLLRATRPDLQAELALLLQIRDDLSRTHAAVNQILQGRKKLRAARQALNSSPAGKLLAAEAARLEGRLGALLQPLAELGFRGIDDQMLVHPLQLNARLAALGGSVASADARPTKQAQETFHELQGALEANLNKLRPLLEEELPAFLKRLPGVSPRPRKMRRPRP